MRCRLSRQAVRRFPSRQIWNRHRKAVRLRTGKRKSKEICLLTSSSPLLGLQTEKIIADRIVEADGEELATGCRESRGASCRRSSCTNFSRRQDRGAESVP